MSGKRDPQESNESLIHQAVVWLLTQQAAGGENFNYENHNDCVCWGNHDDKLHRVWVPSADLNFFASSSSSPSPTSTKSRMMDYDHQEHRYLRRLLTSVLEDGTPIAVSDSNEIPSSTATLEEVTSFDWTSFVLAVLCLVCAAFCAGLILGILSLDSLMLHIKIRAGTDEDETRYAQQLLPLVQQRHLVLVSLLLVNFLADEALPIFMDNLVPTWAAVITSVVLVVFVSEVIPSALFIGPNQLKLAALVSPFAHAVICIMYPVSKPIATLLDYLLQDEDETGNHFNRGELSALVRIQYEGRLAAKRRALKERREEMGIASSPVAAGGTEVDNLSWGSPEDLPPSIQFNSDETFLTTEVNVLEGALALKTTTAKDVSTRIRKAYTIPSDMILDQANMARIYGVGYSRVPVYQKNPKRPKDTTGIIGVMLTRNLILVEPSHRRSVATMPLYQPVCVGPEANMIELLGIFQGGTSGNKGGHMALVCEKPAIATAALDKHKPIPTEAGVIGIITMEDVIEEMLQEPVYDEGDRAERQAMERAEWAFQKWKLYVKRRRLQKQQQQQQQQLQLHELQRQDQRSPPPREMLPLDATEETTPLLSNSSRKTTTVLGANRNFLSPFI